MVRKSHIILLACISIMLFCRSLLFVPTSA